MQVLMLLSDGFGGFGGIAKFNRDFLRALSLSPLVASAHAWPRVIPGPIEELLPEAVVYRRAFQGGKLRYCGHALRDLLLGPACDLVICGHINLLPVAWLVARLRRAALALVVHGIEAWAPTRSPLVNVLARRIDKLLAVSAVTAERFIMWAGVGDACCTILPNSVDATAFTPGPKPQALLARYKLHDRRVIMTMGRMAPKERYKGFDEVIEAMPQLLAAFPDLTYLIAGEGSDRPRLAEKARRLGVAERVVFTGRVTEGEKADHYRLADVFVMPSTGEGFGIVFLEAAACGLPVIGSAADGSREALAGGRFGALVEPASQSALIDAVSTALREKCVADRAELVDRFGVAAFNRRVGDWLKTSEATVR